MARVRYYFLISLMIYRFRNQVPVAVKILQPSQTVAVSKHQKEKFQNEVLLLSKINNNKNIVEVIKK